MRYSNPVLAALLMIGSASALAQRGAPPGGGVNGPTSGEGNIQGYMSQGDVKDLADFVDNVAQLEHKDLVSKAVATKRSEVMLDALHIGCRLTDAEHIASGTSKIGGKPVNLGLYEVACSDGMGYLLTLVGLSSASGISCFAASAAVRSGAPDPTKVDLKCKLPANQNLDAMASAVMGAVGTTCDAHDLKWLGQGGTPKVDYTEVACADGQGFVLRTPTPGSIAGKIDVIGCKDAASHGAQCQLSASAVSAAAPLAAAAGSAAEQRPTLQWFKEALAKNGVTCDVKKARVVGRESIKRRYLVEYQCPQQPRGLVAYVPSPGDTTNPFESIDCDAAAQRKITCQFLDTH